MRPFPYSVVLFLLLGLLSGGCHSDRAVDDIADRFRGAYRTAFMADLPDVAALARLPARLDSLQRYRQQLAQVDTHALSREGKMLCAELHTTLAREWEQFAPFQEDPSLYNLGGMLKRELVQKDPDLTARLDRLAALMDQAHDYYRQARENLRPGEISRYRLAAQKQYLGMEFLQQELPDSLASADLNPETQQLFRQKISYTYGELKDYLAFCESVYLNYMDSTRYAVHK